jgi:hypothetical protein
VLPTSIPGVTFDAVATQAPTNSASSTTKTYGANSIIN